MSDEKPAEKASQASPISPASSTASLPQDTRQRSEQTESQAVQDEADLPMSKAAAFGLVFVLSGASFLNTVGIQSVVIALPSIGKDLDIPAARQQWIVSAYSLAFGCLLLLWGRLGDVYGKRAIFLGGSGFLSLTSLVCPWVRDEIGFNIMRGLQGVGAAANVPTAIGIIGVTFPPGRYKNYAFSFFAAGPPLGAAFGNILGGVLVSYWKWEGIFWVFAILAAIITIGGVFVIPKVDPKPDATGKKAVDWLGGLLITLALFALLFALTQGNIVGWSQAYIGTIIGVSILLIAAFVFYQLHVELRTKRAPLMKLTIFRSAHISSAITVQALLFASFNNFLIFATYFFQDYQHQSPIQTTLRFIPTGVIGAFTVLITSQMLSRIPANVILSVGTMCTSIACMLFAVPIPPETIYWAWSFPAMCLSVFGIDTLYPCLLLFVTQQLPKEDQAIGGGIVTAFAQVGRSMGLAIATAIQVAVEESKMGGDGSWAFLQGLRAAEWFNFGLGIASFLLVQAEFRDLGIIGKAKR